MAVVFHRRELTRQRDFLRWSGRWFAAGLPLWHGMAVILAGAILAGRITWPWVVAFVAGDLILTVFALRRNHREVLRLEHAIDGLSSEIDPIP